MPEPARAVSDFAMSSGARPLVLLVDDDPLILETISACLRPYCDTRVATSSARALAMAHQVPTPDLVLLDIGLDGMSGYELCAAFKRSRPLAEVPVIFVSGHDGVDMITRGFSLGAVDFVTKPIVPIILLARVRAQLRASEAGRLLRHRNADLEAEVLARTRDLQQRTDELLRNQELAIVSLGTIAETRDNETGNHIRRTGAYVGLLARQLAASPAWQGRLPEGYWETIWKSAPLHDLGKVGIPDSILLKPGPLSTEEFEQMKRHTILGRDAICLAEQRVHAGSSFLHVAAEIAGSHHERWDGQGYPDGLAGEAIPLPARLMAVADVYDAITSRRVYKPALPHQQAVEILREGRGTQFDPQVIDCFLEMAGRFPEVAKAFGEH